jgi:hypothetical protein
MTRRKRKLLLGLAIVLILLVVIKLVSNQFNQPTTAKVNFGPPQQTGPAYSIDLTPKLYIGKYAQFDYPKGLIQQKTAAVQPPTLEQINFIGHDISTWTLGINVSNLPNGALSNDSSFTLRQNNPSVYSRSQLNVKGGSVIVMTDKTASHFNKVAFLVRANLVVTVALSGNDAAGNQPLDKTLNMVVSSWSWR